MPEPWLRGTHTELNPIHRQIIHAFELTQEDADLWCAILTDDEINARPFNLAPVAFHLRHIARSLDRLLSYAEGNQLSATQLEALATELDASTTTAAAMRELHTALAASTQRVLALSPEHFNDPRNVGRAHLPSTVAGLLIHCAEHTQRHSGQAITTAKVVLAMR